MPTEMKRQTITLDADMARACYHGLEGIRWTNTLLGKGDFDTRLQGAVAAKVMDDLSRMMGYEGEFQGTKRVKLYEHEALVLWTALKDHTGNIPEELHTSARHALRGIDQLLTGHTPQIP